MKSIIYPIAMFSAILFTSCGNEEAETEENTEVSATEEGEEEQEAAPTINGNWKMTDLNMDMEIPAGQEEAMKTAIDDMIAKSFYNFKDDGTFEGHNGVTPFSGTYKVDGKTLSMESKGQKSTAQITELTKTNLSFEMEDQGMKMSCQFERK